MSFSGPGHRRLPRDPGNRAGTRHRRTRLVSPARPWDISTNSLHFLGHPAVHDVHGDPSVGEVLDGRLARTPGVDLGHGRDRFRGVDRDCVHRLPVPEQLRLAVDLFRGQGRTQHRRCRRILQCHQLRADAPHPCVLDAPRRRVPDRVARAARTAAWRRPATRTPSPTRSPTSSSRPKTPSRQAPNSPRCSTRCRSPSTSTSMRRPRSCRRRTDHRGMESSPSAAWPRRASTPAGAPRAHPRGRRQR